VQFTYRSTSVSNIFSLSLIVLLSLGVQAAPSSAKSSGVEAPMMLAATEGMERRGERRDDRQDCRGDEGIGKDKRDCKQEERREGDDNEGGDDNDEGGDDNDEGGDDNDEASTEQG
jgi:hypothetical protein